MVQYVLMARAYVISRKKSARGKMTRGGPKKWNCTSECKVLTVEECKSIVNLKAIFQESMPSLRQDIESGCIYGHYSIPWEIIAAKHDKLVSSSTVEEDGKTDHSTQQNCQEDGKPGDIPTDDSDEEKEEDSIPLFRQLLPSRLRL